MSQPSLFVLLQEEKVFLDPLSVNRYNKYSLRSFPSFSSHLIISWLRRKGKKNLHVSWIKRKNLFYMENSSFLFSPACLNLSGTKWHLSSFLLDDIACLFSPCFILLQPPLLSFFFNSSTYPIPYYGARIFKFYNLLEEGGGGGGDEEDEE